LNVARWILTVFSVLLVTVAEMVVWPRSKFVTVKLGFGSVGGVGAGDDLEMGAAVVATDGAAEGPVTVESDEHE
jgi:hypothetical protein